MLWVGATKTSRVLEETFQVNLLEKLTTDL